MDKIPTLRIGETFGRFEIADVLPAGGMGEVYRARDPRLNRYVALKLLLRSEDHDLQRFKREGEMAGQFSHPNIVSIFDAGTQLHADREIPYLVMEFVEGTTLRERMRDASDEQVIRWMSEVADGLEALHQRRVTHRDVKPENIMIGTDDHAAHG
jgi:serine/threonine protein kinase